MFRTQEHVPEIYVNESRDFQLLCRLKDAMFGGVKYNIDSLKHTSNTLEMNAALLPLLKSKVGFFINDDLTNDELRYLLAGFPFLIRDKGSERAIKKAVYLWFRVSRIDGTLLNIDINNENHSIDIYIKATATDTRLLDAMFKYILPTGYMVSYLFVEPGTVKSSYISESFIQGLNVHNKVNSNIRDQITESESAYKLKDRLLGRIGFTRIMSTDDYIAESSSENIKVIDKEAEEEQ